MSNAWEQSESNGQNIFAAEAVHAAPIPHHQTVVAENHQPKPAPAADDSGGNIDKIRDILFGGHMRDYDSRFARLEQNLLRESAELRDSTRRLMERMEAHFKAELDALHTRFKTERDERGTALSGVAREMKDMHEALTKRIAEVDDHASGTHHELREQLLQHGRDMGQQLETRHREMSELLEKRFVELRKDKTDRAALASLFNEMALRINHEMHIPGVEH
jgi:hypothetical protein